jgi:hypothetical protein
LQPSMNLAMFLAAANVLAHVHLPALIPAYTTVLDTTNHWCTLSTGFVINHLQNCLQKRIKNKSWQ